MRYINKSLNGIEGKQITKDFLDDVCKDADGRYTEVRYDNRDTGSKPTFCAANGRQYRKRMVGVLLENQKKLCCYCMRKLKAAQHEESDELVTIEHIIPRGYSAMNAPQIRDYQRVRELSPEEIILTDVFETPCHNQGEPAHPHKVAYNNLIVSCNGTFPEIIGRKGGKSKICCNEARGESMAFPIYYLSDIEELVDYTNDGGIQSVIGNPYESQIEEVIANTRLDCMSLKDIRRLWYELRICSYRRVYSCRTVESRDELFSMILYTSPSMDCETASRLHTKFIDDNQWNTFMLYNAFYNIMRDKYPTDIIYS